MNPIMVELVTVGEERDVDRVTDVHGNTIDLLPVPNSERYFVVIKMPDGVDVKAYVSEADYENHASRAWGNPVDVDSIVDIDSLSRHL